MHRPNFLLHICNRPSSLTWVKGSPTRCRYTNWRTLVANNEVYSQGCSPANFRATLSFSLCQTSRSFLSRPPAVVENVMGKTYFFLLVNVFRSKRGTTDQRSEHCTCLGWSILAYFPLALHTSSRQSYSISAFKF
jgi:hypothetical protein